MLLGELVTLYKKHGDLPIYYRDFDGMMIEAGSQYIHSAIQGFHKLIIPCDETETVMRLGTGKVVTRQKAQQCTLKDIVDDASEQSDIPVYVKYFSDTDINPSSARCEVLDGKLVFYNDKAVWDECENYKKRRDENHRKYMESRGNNFDVQLPIIRNAEPELLAEKLVSVKPIAGPLPHVEPITTKQHDALCKVDDAYNSTQGSFVKKIYAAYKVYLQNDVTTLSQQIDFWKHLAYLLADSANTATRAMRKEHNTMLAYMFELNEREKEFNFKHKSIGDIVEQWEAQRDKIHKKVSTQLADQGKAFEKKVSKP